MSSNGSSSQPEEAAEFNGTIKMTGGLFVGAGSNSNMTKAMNTTSTQPNLYISSSGMIFSSTFLHIQNPSVMDVLTFTPKNGTYKFLFSSNNLSKGASYSIYSGGSYSGGSNKNGLYNGGT